MSVKVQKSKTIEKPKSVKEELKSKPVFSDEKTEGERVALIDHLFKPLFEHGDTDGYRVTGAQVEIYYLGNEYVVPGEIVNILMNMKGKDHMVGMWNKL